MNTRSHAATLLDMADLLRPNAIRAAAALRLADRLADGPLTARALADRTDADPVMLTKLLRYLVELGVLRTEGGDAFALTELGEPLRRDSAQSLGQFLSPEGLFGRADLGLVGLLHTVRTGESSYAAAFGREYWDDINGNPVFAEALDAEGPTRIAFDAEIIVEGYDWSGVRRVVDVGGNNGTLLMELLVRHPHLTGAVLDLPAVAGIAARRIAEAGLADRGEALAGSFFDPLPAGADVYLLSGVLADWSDERAVEILARCGEAAGPAGRVLLAEINLDMGSSGQSVAATDLWVSATVPTPSRTVGRLRELGAAAGLAVSWEGPATRVRSLLEFRAGGRDA
ncbi:methyltransferase [Streptomyces sp. NPDC015131]|uniref:methyltransferase n=1 Tax=Streptomyces sp. NPDC015131 TaxID=3364941 RepID=UPI0036FAD32A